MPVICRESPDGYLLVIFFSGPTDPPLPVYYKTKDNPLPNHIHIQPQPSIGNLIPVKIIFKDWISVEVMVDDRFVIDFSDPKLYPSLELKREMKKRCRDKIREVLEKEAKVNKKIAGEGCLVTCLPLKKRPGSQKGEEEGSSRGTKRSRPVEEQILPPASKPGSSTKGPPVLSNKPSLCWKPRGG